VNGCWLHYELQFLWCSHEVEQAYVQQVNGNEDALDS